MSSFQKRKQYLRQQGRVFWYYQALLNFSPLKQLDNILNQIPFRNQDEKEEFIRYYKHLNEKLYNVDYRGDLI